MRAFHNDNQAELPASVSENKNSNYILIRVIFIGIALFVTFYALLFIAENKKDHSIATSSLNEQLKVIEANEKAPILMNFSDPTIQQTYSLWLEPQGSLQKALKAEINSLGALYNGTFHDPHSTLYGPIISTNLTTSKIWPRLWLEESNLST